MLANAGVASRRVCEDYIVAGRVRVNGRVVTELGTRIDPPSDLVDVDGTAVQLDATKRYIMLNKPTGVVSSMKDEQGRPDLRRFTKEWDERLYNVGRLDAETSGLLVLTNDGDLAHVLAHPSFGVTKVYIAKVSGRVTAQTIATLTKGIELDDGPIAADKARLLDASSTGERRDEPGGADPALGPQSHRAPHDGGGRAPGGRARATAVRAVAPGHAPSGPGARVDYSGTRCPADGGAPRGAFAAG